MSDVQNDVTGNPTETVLHVQCPSPECLAWENVQITRTVAEWIGGPQFICPTCGGHSDRSACQLIYSTGAAIPSYEPIITLSEVPETIEPTATNEPATLTPNVATADTGVATIRTEEDTNEPVA